ncbi:hypothetical protein DFH06DRAFT_1288514 [Mycena polygramma]|nr:hypothetical protein DFH06DRAFT_1288514 [Mycena polygramma]
MPLPNILFNPTARVWNLRVLVLEIIVVCGLLVLALRELEYGRHTLVLASDILFSTFGFILIHHLSFVLNWSMPCLAILDLMLIFFEVWGIASGFTFVNIGLWHANLGTKLRSLLTFAFIPIGLSLTISAAFRVATIIRSKGRFFRQRFMFLGACTTLKLPYTPMAIILNRSIGRPLVSCIGLAVPAFGIYTMVLSPIRAQIYTRSVATFGELGSPPGNATFAMVYSMYWQSEDVEDDFSINFVTVQTNDSKYRSYNCSVTFDWPSEQRLVECPLLWASVLSVSISINIPSGFVVTIVALPEKPIIALGSDADFGIIFGLVMTDGPLLSGSHPFDPASASNEATLLLYQPDPTASKLEQDSSDVSLLSGLSTFGGFWTFVNGAFALFFGANVIYFALGRRPLSALGLIHIFQRNALVRSWHTDFPALRIEGGAPGSESAGVVAFIRERLIDIEEEPPATSKTDAESQNSDFDQTGNGSRVSIMDTDYRLELPLLNSSLGFENGVSRDLGGVESQT